LGWLHATLARSTAPVNPPKGILLSDFRSAAETSELGWDLGSQTGAVFHMLRALEQHGRIGVTAIGDSPDQAHEIYLGAAALLDWLAVKKTSLG
jgi:PGM1 C-terminal domain